MYAQDIVMIDIPSVIILCPAIASNLLDKFCNANNTRSLKANTKNNTAIEVGIHTDIAAGIGNMMTPIVKS